MSPATEDRSSAPALTDSSEYQTDLPRSGPTIPTVTVIGKVGYSLSSAVGYVWRSIRNAGRPFCRTANPTVRVHRCRSGSASPVLTRSYCSQGRIHPLPFTDSTDSTDVDSVSCSSDESWDFRESKKCRLCSQAGQREALDLYTTVVELSPPCGPPSNLGLCKAFSSVMSPASHNFSEYGTVMESEDQHSDQDSDLLPDAAMGCDEVQTPHRPAPSNAPGGKLKDPLLVSTTRPPMSWQKPSALRLVRPFVAEDIEDRIEPVGGVPSTSADTVAAVKHRAARRIRAPALERMDWNVVGHGRSGKAVKTSPRTPGSCALPRHNTQLPLASGVATLVEPLGAGLLLDTHLRKAFETPFLRSDAPLIPGMPTYEPAPQARKRFRVWRGQRTTFLKIDG